MNSLIIQSLLLMSLASQFSCSARFGTGLIGRSHHERTDESLDIIKAYQRKYQLNYLPQIDLFDGPLRSGMSVSIFGKLFSDSNGYEKAFKKNEFIFFSLRYFKVYNRFYNCRC